MMGKNEMKWRRCFLAGLWFLALAGISFYGGAVSYGFFFGVTFIPVVSLIYLLCVYFRFKIYQETEKRNLVCGQPTPYYFILQNEDHFVYTGVSVKMHTSFSYTEDSFEDTEYELFPGDKKVCETSLICRYRGEYEIGVKEVILTDFLRLFRFRYKVQGQIKASASPRIVGVRELKSVADLPVPVQGDIAGSSEPDIPVRDYMEGDSLKQIHWKATARQQKLKVGIMTGKENQRICIFCDTKRYSEDRTVFLPLENKILEAFLAVGYYFAGMEREFYAYYAQGGIMRDQVKGIGRFEEFYHRVSGISFDRREDLGSLLRRTAEQGGLWDSGVVFCILHDWNPEILDITERLAAQGVVTAIYVITDEDPRKYIRQGNSRRRVAVIPVEAELEGRL